MLSFILKSGAWLFCTAFCFPAFAQDIITVDEQAAEFYGSWQTINEKKGYAHGTTFRYAMMKESASPNATATFRPHLQTAGLYHVEVYSSPGRNRSSISCTISSSNGEIKVAVDQTKSPAGWQRIAENISFAAGNKGFVQLGNHTAKLDSIDKIVLADGVRFIRAGDATAGIGDIMEATEAIFQGSWSRHNAAGGWLHTNYTFASSSAKNATATYQPNLPKDGRYDIYIWNDEGKEQSADATWEISSKVGNRTVQVDQRKNAGDWFQIGSGVEFAAGKSGFIRLSNKTQSGSIVANAVAFVYIGPP